MPVAELGRVLLIDDEQHVRRVLSRVLGSAGYQVDLACDGDEGLALLQSGLKPSVIITDLLMPRASGIQFLQALRATDADVPVILITGEPTLDSAIAAIEFGGYRYLSKPIANGVLLSVVASAVAVHRLALLKRRALRFYEDEGGELSDLGAAFERALSCIWIAFQPIVNARERRIVGHEALLRSNELTLPTPELLLRAAERLGRMPELGRAAREAVGRALSRAPEESLIFVNLHPSELTDAALYSDQSLLTAYSKRVVLEVTERSALEAVSGLREKVNALRQAGFRIAIGELGAGQAGLANFIQIEPDIVKLDMTLIRGIADSASKQALVQGMISVCVEELGLQVVCEGVETELERDVLHELGAQLLQGFLFARPAPRFCDEGIFELSC